MEKIKQIIKRPAFIGVCIFLGMLGCGMWYGIALWNARAKDDKPIDPVTINNARINEIDHSIQDNTKTISDAQTIIDAQTKIKDNASSGSKALIIEKEKLLDANAKIISSK